MKIKRFVAGSMREAIRLVREEQGPEAVILSNRRVPGGIEVVSATDYDAALMQAVGRREAPAAPVAAHPSAAAAPRPQAAPAAMPAPEIQQLRREIGGMRKLFERQMAHLAWRDLNERQPQRLAALKTMTEIGLDARLAYAIADELPRDVDGERARFLPLGLLSRRLPIAGNDPIVEGGVIALVGPTGVGKTTTIAKLAARFAERHGTRDIALVTTDHYRVGAQEQLYTYGRLLGVPVQTASNAEELRGALARLSDRKLVLIDTAGMGPRDQKLAAQFAELQAARREIRTWLVLPATSQAGDQEDILKRFAPAHPEACVLSKLDEATRIGGSLSTVIRHGLTINYLCDGQRVPEDLQAARADQIVLRAVQLARQMPAGIHDGTLALQFGSLYAGT
ncbi:flagellar biosynthesis protein FlhF [Fontimonas sp. SYSU GA230001]|uniref:flagellar biosynthesis protein FlhF n=1 Tax=Fontimonas sp. SYSU GA230001 TaxID=3142450 RepID=UPI0032B43B4F